MRKKYLKPLAIISVIAAQIALGLAYRGGQVLNVKADSEPTYGRSASSGTVIYVGGGSFFNTGEADLAIYCFNSESDNAWSDRVSYRCYGSLLRVMVPYQNGNSKTWAKLIVCRYNPNKNPQSDGWDGVYNQTNDIGFGEFLYAQNTINITGYGQDGKLTYSLNANDYYGIRGERHMYLDLSGFQHWEEADAKFAIYFAYPNSTNESRWSQIYENGSYHASFCWKVEGQDNDHLYECIVPNIYSGGDPNIWNLVIAVRFDPNEATPSFDSYWNKTQDISFNSSNHTANMLHINDWGEGQLDTINIISDESRVGFYGNYFLNTVTCSGTGASDATTSTQWTSAKIAYNHLSRKLQGTVWTTTADEEGTLIQQAMARYDYIVLFRQYSHEDFINRAESPNKTVYSNSVNLVNNSITSSDYMTVISIIAIIMSASVITLIVLKKYKSRKR